MKELEGKYYRIGLTRIHVKRASRKLLEGKDHLILTGEQYKLGEDYIKWTEDDTLILPSSVLSEMHEIRENDFKFILCERLLDLMKRKVYEEGR